MEETKMTVVENAIEEVKDAGLCEVSDAAVGKTSLLTKIVLGLSAVLALIGIGKGIKKLIAKVKAKKEAKKIEKAEKEGFVVVTDDEVEEADGEDASEEE